MLKFQNEQSQYSKAAGLTCFAQCRLGTCFKLKAKDGVNRLTHQSQRCSMDPSHKMPMQCCWSNFCTGNISMCNFEMDYYEMGFAFFLSKSLLSIVFLKKSKGCVPLVCNTGVRPHAEIRDLPNIATEHYGENCAHKSPLTMKFEEERCKSETTHERKREIMNSQKSQGCVAFEWRTHLTVNLKSDIISLPTISALLEKYCQTEKEKTTILFMQNQGFLKNNWKNMGRASPTARVGRVGQ